MKNVILIGGDLASGKSTYSHILQNALSEYKFLLVNKDNLKEILGDDIKCNNRTENKVLSKISFNLIKYILLQSDCNVIVESNFKPYEMDELNILLKNDNVISVILKGDNEVLHKRFLNRLNENRHEVHKSQDFTNIEDFIKTLKELRCVKYIGKNILVDSTNFDYQVDENIIKEIMGNLK